MEGTVVAEGRKIESDYYGINRALGENTGVKSII